MKSEGCSYEVLCHLASIMSPNGMRLDKIAKISIDSVVNL